MREYDHLHMEQWIGAQPTNHGGHTITALAVKPRLRAVGLLPQQDDWVGR
jgi:hypothetical protein